MILNDVNPALVKESDTKNFVTDVIEASKSVPVIVDFWAPWCGPCKALGPVIEKVVRESKGKVRLVKIDIDKSPEIAGQLRVQSIPAVFAFVKGKPVDGFMGALPESQVRQFVSRLGSMGSQAEQIAAAMQMARESLAARDFEGVLDAAGQIIEFDGANAEAYAMKARAEMGLGDLAAAQTTLAACPPEKRGDANILSALAALELMLHPVDTSGISQLEKKVVVEPNNYALRLELAELLNAAGDRGLATDHLIHVIRKDRTFNEDGARKQLVSYFEAWGPKDDATLAGRRKLASVLFS